MNNRVRVIFYGMMIALLALASAFSVIPARADDGAPPPPTGDSVATASSTAGTAAVLSQVPAGTEVVAVNERGHKVALASQEAARIVANGDPVWCPTGVVPGGASCSSAFTTFTGDGVLDAGLISVLGGKTVSGTIWIESSYNSSLETLTAVTLDGSALGTTANHALILNGGWSGTGTSLTPLTPSVFDGASLSIIGWKNAITLNNLTIENADDEGLYVTTTGNICLLYTSPSPRDCS